MKRRQTNESEAQAVGSAVAATADGSDAEQRGEGVGAQEAIARRAHELYLERGSQPGGDLEDWFRAEAELGDGRQ